MGSSFNRMYIILRPADGHATGFARLEGIRGRSRLHIQASRLPKVPVRAMLLAGDANSHAILDLGLMHTLPGQQCVLSRDDLALHGGYHTLLLCADWPDPRVLLYGCLSRSACPLWQMQEAVRHYLFVPAGPSAAQETPRPSVLMLRTHEGT